MFQCQYLVVGTIWKAWDRGTVLRWPFSEVQFLPVHHVGWWIGCRNINPQDECFSTLQANPDNTTRCCLVPSYRHSFYFSCKFLLMETRLFVRECVTSSSHSVFGEQSQFHNELGGESLTRSQALFTHARTRTHTNIQAHECVKSQGRKGWNEEWVKYKREGRNDAPLKMKWSEVDVEWQPERGTHVGVRQAV